MTLCISHTTEANLWYSITQCEALCTVGCAWGCVSKLSFWVASSAASASKNSSNEIKQRKAKEGAMIRDITDKISDSTTYQSVISLFEITIWQNRVSRWRLISVTQQRHSPNPDQERQRQQRQHRQEDWEHRRAHQGMWSAGAWDHDPEIERSCKGRPSVNQRFLWMRLPRNDSQWQGERLEWISGDDGDK